MNTKKSDEPVDDIKERRRAYCKAYREKNKERRKMWYEANKERIRQTQRDLRKFLREEKEENDTKLKA